MQERTKCFDKPLNIYEVHAGSWRQKEDGSWYTYAELADLLPAYCKKNGFTHIELMPLAEHPFDGSWGYQVTGYFAPTSRYGTPDELVEFVNACHKQGIGVILDFVPVHFAVDAYGLKEFDGTPLYEYPAAAVGQSEWGSCNFMHSRGEIRCFIQSCADYCYHFTHSALSFAVVFFFAAGFFAAVFLLSGFFVFSAAFSCFILCQSLGVLLLLLGSQLLYSLAFSFLNLLVVLVIHGRVFFAVDFLVVAFFRCLLDLFLGLAVLLGGLLGGGAFRSLGGTRFTHLAALFGFLRRQALLDQLLVAAASRRQTSVTSLESRSVWRNSEESQFGHLVLSGLSHVMNWQVG